VTTLHAPAPVPAVASLRRSVSVRVAWLIASIALLVVLAVASVAFGVADVSPADLVAGLSGNASSIESAAVIKRMPRTVLAILVGASLALAGASMQAVTRNPLADPGIFGVMSGAALAVVAGLAFFGIVDPYGQMGLAILGAAAAAIFVYAVGSLGRGGATPLKLALAGAATAAALASLVSAILLPRIDVMSTFRFWQIGGVGGAEWDRIAVVAPALLIGALIVFATARGLNSLALGDDLAAGLGEHVARTRLISSAGAVILCGAATAIAGPIAFVGLVIPHLVRLLVGPDHRWLLPLSAIGGAVLLLAADIVGRLVAKPEEIEVGIVTALIGAPVFIWIVRRQKVREL